MDDETWREQLLILEQFRAQFVRLQSLRHKAGWRAARIWDLAEVTRLIAEDLEEDRPGWIWAGWADWNTWIVVREREHRD
jgi:hypothetical protein